MKKALLITALIIAFISCKKESDKSDRIKVILIENDDPVFFKKSVYLYDNSDYLIKTNLSTFISEWPFENSFSDDYDKNIKSKVISDSEQKDSLNLSNYLLYPHDSIYILAHYLETGKCLVFDRHLNQIVKYLEFENYVIGEDWSSYRGRRFYIKYQLFLETVDAISKK